MSRMLFIQIIVNGITMGMLYTLVALGLTLLYGIMHIINFSHGEIFMLGGFLSYFLMKAGMNYFAALTLSMGVMFLVGVLFERIFFRPARGNFLNCFLITLGLSVILQSLGWILLGTEDVTIPSPFVGLFTLGDIVISKEKLFAIIISAIFVTFLFVLVFKTKIGRDMRALEQDIEASELFGVNVSRITKIALGVSFALAAAAGTILGSIFNINPGIGFLPMLKGLIVIVMGGLGSIGGCVLAGILLGLVESFSSYMVGSNIAYSMVFVVFIIVLIVRPVGLLGHVK